MRYQSIKERENAMKFKKVIKRERMARAFDPDKTITMAGKTFVVRERIQEARADTEIYPTLEKYGTLDRMQINPYKVYADFGGMKSLKDIMDQQNEAKRLWNNLPFDVRKQFDNNIGTFIKEGESWLKKQIEAQTPKETVATETPKETATTEMKGE